MPVSIYDIAEKANVAPSTVSRALQNNPRIAEKTRKRIQELADQMEYVPSTVAKSLVSNQTWTIGIVLAAISDPFMGRVVEGVEHVAHEGGFNIFLSMSQNDGQRELAAIKLLKQRRVDGIIMLASHVLDGCQHYFDRVEVPIVVINEQEPLNTLHAVAVDDVRGARLAVEHLLQLGHRRIAYVGIGNRPKSNKRRRQGYEQALAAAGIDLDPALVIESNHIEDHAQRGEASVEHIVAAGGTAAFCYNDATAIGVLSACYRRGLVVPNNLSVIGFDDIDIAAYTVPPLTMIRQPRFDLGQRAMQSMIDLLQGNQPANLVLPGELVIRSTTAEC